MELKETMISPLGFSFTLAAGLLFVFLPRRLALVPLFLLVSFMTLGETIVIANCNFTMWRVLLIFGWCRILVKREFYSAFKLNKIDVAILLWIVTSVLANFLLWQTEKALINRLGFAYNILGTYFLIRILLYDIMIFEKLIKIIAILIIPLAAFMAVEHFTRYNVFSIFGGVPEQSLMRGESIRCQGPFRHPILAGVYGATLMPFFILLICTKGNRLLGFVSLAAAVIVAATASSSGALMGCMSGLFGMALYPAAKHIRKIKWSFFAMLIFMQLIMSSPIWYGMSRISDLLGGTGWHRSYLIDQSIRYFDEWWLLGTKDTSYWMPYWRTDGQADITNQYIEQGVNGGIIPMILFILVIVFSFSQNGAMLKKIDNDGGTKNIIFWAMGVTLFSHALIFISVPYFDQIIVMYLFVIAGIAMSKKMENISDIQPWNYQS